MTSKLSPFPLEKGIITHPYIVKDNLFTNEEIDKIVKYCDEQGTRPGTVINQQTGEETVSRYRKSNIKFHTINEDTAWIFNKVFSLTEFVNDSHYNFDLWGCEAFQYTEYSELGSSVDYHIDTILGRVNTMGETRKLSLSVCLTEPNIDYKGGEFHICQDNQNIPIVVEQKKGRCIFFPSFLVHGVTPILSGSRKALVFWFTGPKFR